MLKGVLDLYVRASKNLSITESAKVKELLVKHNETTFHDPEKTLTATNTIVHEIPMTGRPVRILTLRVAPGRRKIIEYIYLCHSLCFYDTYGYISMI